MGAYKNHEFLGQLEREQERERMELARREQEYLLGRSGSQSRTVGLSATTPRRVTGSGVSATIPNAKKKH